MSYSDVLVCRCGLGQQPHCENLVPNFGHCQNFDSFGHQRIGGFFILVANKTSEALMLSTRSVCYLKIRTVCIFSGFRRAYVAARDNKMTKHSRQWNFSMTDSLPDAVWIVQSPLCEPRIACKHCAFQVCALYHFVGNWNWSQKREVRGPWAEEEPLYKQFITLLRPVSPLSPYVSLSLPLFPLLFFFLTL